MSNVDSLSSWSSEQSPGETHCFGGSSHSYCGDTWVRTTLSPGACANGYYRHLNNSKWFCSFLQRFRPKVRESVQSFTGSSLQRSEAWGFAAVSSWTYASNHCCPICSINENQPQNTFRRESDYFNYSDCFARNRQTLIWLIILIRQSSLANLKWSLCLSLFCSFLGRRPLESQIFPLICLLKRVSWVSCDKR